MFYRKRKARYEDQIEKLKLDNFSLREDLRAVVFEPMSERSLRTKTIMTYSRDMENVIWSGERTDPMHDVLEQHPMNGIMFQIEEKDEKFPTEYE